MDSYGWMYQHAFLPFVIHVDCAVFFYNKILVLRYLIYSSIPNLDINRIRLYIRPAESRVQESRAKE